MSHYGHENIPDAKLSPVALLVFEIYVTKFPSEKRAQVIKFSYLAPENGLSF